MSSPALPLTHVETFYFICLRLIVHRWWIFWWLWGFFKEDIRRIVGTTYHEWLQIYFGRECVIAKNTYLFVILPYLSQVGCYPRFFRPCVRLLVQAGRRWPPRWVRWWCAGRSSLAMVPASLVDWRCASLKYAGTVTTACFTSWKGGHGFEARQDVEW